MFFVVNYFKWQAKAILKYYFPPHSCACFLYLTPVLASDLLGTSARCLIVVFKRLQALAKRGVHSTSCEISESWRLKNSGRQLGSSANTGWIYLRCCAALHLGLSQVKTRVHNVSANLLTQGELTDNSNYVYIHITGSVTTDTLTYTAWCTLFPSTLSRDSNDWNRANFSLANRMRSRKEKR